MRKVIVEEAQIERAKAMRSLGMPVTLIAKRISVPYHILRLRLGNLGHATIRLDLRLFTPDQEQALADRYRSGESAIALASEIGKRLAVVWRILHRAGIPRINKRCNGRFVGKQGYIFVHAPDHPMALSNGYVMEHRLAMSEKIGRPLTDKETVHHVNGDRADNRIENLQLRHGRHGHGVSFVCRKCGSCDVIPVKL